MYRFRKLDPDSIIKTLERLQQRIDDRFPGAGLGVVCAELTQIARGATQKAEKIAAPNLWLRGSAAAVIAVGVVLLYYIRDFIRYTQTSDNLSGVLQGLDALVNLIVVIGAGILFLSTLEGRWKRQEALADLNELRNIVHVIDMHQLTKDPSATVPISGRTKHSPERNLTSFELMRYLDYSSELLSLTAKVAALYGQSFHDPGVLAAVRDLGQITTNMTNQIWQKITIIQAGEDWKAASAERASNRLAKADPSRWVVRRRASSSQKT